MKPHALILAGGRGTRLQSVVSDLPKPMATIAGKPFLEHQLSYLKAQGILQATLLTGYRHETIEKYFADGSRLEMQIRYSQELSPLGTGGAIAQAVQNIAADDFLILNGDSLFLTDLRVFLEQVRKPLTIALRDEADVSRYGSVDLTPDGRIIKFHEKTGQIKGGLINAGIYYLHRDLVKHFKKDVFSLEKDVFEPLSRGSLGGDQSTDQNHSIFGIECTGHFIDIGLPESYSAAQKLIPEWTQR